MGALVSPETAVFIAAAAATTPEKKSNHRANIIRIGVILSHSNADNLELVPIPDTGYQVVVRKGEFKPGDLAVYIQPDSVVPQTEPFRFIWGEHVGIDGKVPERRRRITVRKLPVYDVDAFKNHASAFLPGEMVVVTEKIHGSNARYVCIDDVMYAGSRQQWKLKGNNVWWKALEQNPAIEDWCRAHPDYALYGDVTPTQKNFDYGCKKGEVRFFAFDILSPEGEWLSPKVAGILLEPFPAIRQVPPLYVGLFDKGHIMSLVDGPSQVADAKHIREGVIVKAVKNRSVRGLGRLQLKIVSNAFLKKDSE